MRKKTKYMNTDILSIMKGIVDRSVRYYQSDFDIDTELIKEAALKKERTERIFVWLCRKCGTWILKEKNIFIKGTRENNTFCFYAEQTSDNILAFVVEVTVLDGNTVTGNLYALDYKLYYEHVKKAAVQAGSIIITYENGQRTIPHEQHFGAYPDYELGAFVSYKFIPQSPEQLEMVLANEKRSREHFKEVIPAESR